MDNNIKYWPEATSLIKSMLPEDFEEKFLEKVEEIGITEFHELMLFGMLCKEALGLQITTARIKSDSFEKKN